MRFYLNIYLVGMALYLLSASGRIGLSDSIAMVHVSQNIIKDGSFSSEPCIPDLPGHPNHCVLGKDGRYYSGFGLVPSILAVPAVSCAQLVSRLSHLNSLLLVNASASLLTALISPLVCVVLAMWLIQLGYTRRTAILGACILGLASPFWHFAVKGFYSEPYSTLALLTSAYLLFSRKVPLNSAFAGFAFGLACGSRINMVILFPAFIVAQAIDIHVRELSFRHLFRNALLFSTTLSVCGFLIGLSNYTRFGSPLKTGYHLAYPSVSTLLSHSLFQGIGDILFNGEVGLLIFSPWLLLVLFSYRSFMRAHLAEGVLCTTIFLLNFVFFAKYDSWHGGWVAGARFLVPTLPFVIVAMAPLIERLPQASGFGPLARALLRPTAVILVVLGFLVQLLGTLYPEERYYTLMEYYNSKPGRPWWTGSIPLASLDYLPKIATTKMRASRPVEPVTDELSLARAHLRAWASVAVVANEEDFLNMFPHSENLTQPNLMLVNMKRARLSTFVLWGYVIFAVGAGFLGLRGLKSREPFAPESAVA